MTCLETGCGGTVVDGYCDVCGTAPAPREGRADVDGSDGVGTASLRADRRDTGPVPRPRAPVDDSARASSRCRRFRRGNPATAILTDPQVPENQPILRQLRLQQTCRTRTRRRTRAPRGLLHPVRHAVTRSFPSFLAAISSVGSTRCRAASPTAGSAGSTWRSTATCTTAWWSSRVWSTPATPTRWPPPPPKPWLSPRWSTPTSSASTTSSSTWIRQATHRRLHRHGVRRRNVAQADPQGAQRSSATGSGRRLHRRNRAGSRLPARLRALPTATSSPTT